MKNFGSFANGSFNKPPGNTSTLNNGNASDLGTVNGTVREGGKGGNNDSDTGTRGSRNGTGAESSDDTLNSTKLPTDTNGGEKTPSNETGTGTENSVDTKSADESDGGV